MSLRRAALLAPLLLVLLTGCVPTTESPAPDPTMPPASITPNPTPTITPTPSAETRAVPFTCPELLSAQAIYDYNPNVTLLPSFSPDDDSLAGMAIAQQGLACSVVNQTSGMTVDFGIVNYTDAALAAKMAAVAASSTAASAFDGYFDSRGDVGAAQLFSATYYLTVESADFRTEADIAPLVQIAREALG